MNFTTFKLGEVLRYEQPTKYIVRNENYSEKNSIPVLTAGKSFILGYTDETDNIFTDVPVIIFDDFTTSIKFVDFAFKVKSSAMKILRAETDIANIRYLFYMMLTIKVNRAEHKRYWISKYSNIQIHLPSLKKQEIATKILDKALAIKDKDVQLLNNYNILAKSIFFDMFGDPVRNERGWEIKKLSDIGQLDRGVSKHRPRNAPELIGGNYPLVQTGDVANSEGIINTYKSTYSEYGLKQSKLWPKGTLCITIAANIAKTGILNFSACFPDSIVGFIPNKLSNNQFVQYLFQFLQKMLEDGAPEAAQKNINLGILRNLKIISPPVELQDKFAKKILNIELQKLQVKAQIQASEKLFQSLLQKAFNQKS